MRFDPASTLAGLRHAVDASRSKLVAVGKANLGSVAVLGPLGSTLNSGPPEGLRGEAVHPYMLSLEHARASELQGPGSAVACLVYAESLILGRFESPKSVVGRAFLSRDVRALLEGVLSDRDRDALSGFVAEAGASRYVVEPAPARFDAIEFTQGHELKHASKPVEGVVAMDGARVLVVDGFVETVAEVHRVLDACARAGDRLIVCARGCSDDVAHTVAVNRARGSLVCYVLTFPYDEDDANTLVDIASLLGGDVVSSLKGQLMSAVDPTALPRAPSARLRGQTLELRASSARAEALLAEARSKLLEADELVRPSLEKRVRRLTGASMIVHLASGPDHAARLEAWDLALRTLRAAAKGVVEVAGDPAWPGRSLAPLTSMAAAVEASRKLVTSLRSLHACV